MCAYLSPALGNNLASTSTASATRPPRRIRSKSLILDSPLTDSSSPQQRHPVSLRASSFFRRSWMTSHLGSSSSISSTSSTPNLASEAPTMSEYQYFDAAAPLDTTVEVVVNSEVVMLGGTETGSHYSLTGIVYITFPLLSNDFFYSRVLTDVTLAFEGKSEYWDPEGRYTPLRLYASSYRLLRQEALIPGHLDHGNTKIAIDFDISIPGWMPPSHVTDRTGTCYGLEAKATVVWAPECVEYLRIHSHRPQEFWSGMKRTAKSEYTHVIIRRHRLPSAVSVSAENPLRTRTFHSPKLGLDVDIRSREWYDLNSPDGIDIRLDLRTSPKRGSNTATAAATDTDAATDTVTATATCSTASPTATTTTTSTATSTATPEDSPKRGLKRLLSRKDSSPRFHEMGMDISEVSIIRSTPSKTFTSSFPLPSQRDALLGPSFCTPLPPSKLKPARMQHTRICSLGWDGTQMTYRFKKDELTVSKTWRSVNATLSPGNGPGQPQSDMSASFIRITHFLRIRLTFRMGDKLETEWFDVPIRLGTSPRTMGEQTNVPPPYVSVFYENGEVRECDPLPLYVRCPPEGGMYCSIPISVVPTSPPLLMDDLPAMEEDEGREGSASPRCVTPVADAGDHGDASTSRRSAADDLSSSSRKIFEQWARERLA